MDQEKPDGSHFAARKEIVRIRSLYKIFDLISLKWNFDPMKCKCALLAKQLGVLLLLPKWDTQDTQLK